ncbi:hypothetical protein AVEN_158182-1 [Araneus ventricosus]|uniref:Uncharacterized protein n=1 Tax=Araneus ventricosus TaxID=182803 RepID=A0A4Y2G9J0_ARAVE|nr:hypothetical protein AVEN_158182-1 [Araneus ventricosus]
MLRCRPCHLLVTVCTMYSDHSRILRNTVRQAKTFLGMEKASLGHRDHRRCRRCRTKDLIDRASNMSRSGQCNIHRRIQKANFLQTRGINRPLWKWQ